MKFKINNREWTITEVSQQAIKNMQNIRKANEEDVADIVSNSYDIIHEIVDKYFEVKNE